MNRILILTNLDRIEKVGFFKKKLYVFNLRPSSPGVTPMCSKPSLIRTNWGSRLSRINENPD